MKIDNVIKIVPLDTITKVTEEKPYIEGVYNYNGKALKVVSLRKLLGQNSLDDELQERLHIIKEDHIKWKEALRVSALEEVPFEKTTDPTKCRLGALIEETSKCMTCGSDFRESIYHRLKIPHDAFHQSADEILHEDDFEKRVESLETSVEENYNKIITELESFEENLSFFTKHYQKALLISMRDREFFVLVDTIHRQIEIERPQITPIKSNPPYPNTIDIGQTYIVENHPVVYVDFSDAFQC
jgi:chemotaxis signal transduction protein